LADLVELLVDMLDAADTELLLEVLLSLAAS